MNRISKGINRLRDLVRKVDNYQYTLLAQERNLEELKAQVTGLKPEYTAQAQNIIAELKNEVKNLEEKLEAQQKNSDEIKATLLERLAPPKLEESYRVGWQPELIPPLNLMREEGMEVLEEWFSWADEWKMVLTIYGGLTRKSKVLEIGSGLGRIAYPLRYLLSPDGSYDGFEICKFKVDFLEETFMKAYPNFRFQWADIQNTFYNAEGKIQAAEYQFPYQDNSFDIIFAASVFTHLLPETTEHYFQETARVLKPDGKAVFSCFLLDNLKAGQIRPFVYKDKLYSFEHRYEQYGDKFAVGRLDNPEHTTAYTLDWLKEFADKAGLELAQALPGVWSGSHTHWVGSQDLIVLRRIENREEGRAVGG